LKFKAQLEKLTPSLTQTALLRQIIELYPNLQKQFFLKWDISAIHNEVEQFLQYFISERVISVEGQIILITQSDEAFRFLASFEHLYTMNLQI